MSFWYDDSLFTGWLILWWLRSYSIPQLSKLRRVGLGGMLTSASWMEGSDSCTYKTIPSM